MGLKFSPPAGADRYAIAWGDQFKSYQLLSSAKQKYYTIDRYAYSRSTTVRILERVNDDWYILFEVMSNTAPKDLPWFKANWRGTKHKATSMTREEYAAWRLAVEHERLGLAEYQPGKHENALSYDGASF